MTPRHVLKGQIMNKVKDAMEKLSGNNKVPTKKILVVVGSVVGIALTIGLIAKRNSLPSELVSSVVDPLAK